MFGYVVYKKVSKRKHIKRNAERRRKILKDMDETQPKRSENHEVYAAQRRFERMFPGTVGERQGMER